MRFNRQDWLRLALACAAASVASAALSLAAHAGLEATPGLARLSPLLAPVTTTLVGVASVLLEALVVWMVLRRCVAGLRLWHWLLAVAGGVALAALVLPALWLNMPGPGIDPLALDGGPGHAPAGWLTVILSGAAPLLPPGLLLWRLTGASPWPLVGIGALSAVVRALAWPTLGPWVLRYVFLLAFGEAPLVWLVVSGLAVAVLSGLLYGLTIGAGLFLMAHFRSRRAAA